MLFKIQTFKYMLKEEELTMYLGNLFQQFDL